MTRDKRRVVCVDRDAMLNQILRNQQIIMNQLCRSQDFEARQLETAELIGPIGKPARCTQCGAITIYVQASPDGECPQCLEEM